MNEARTDERAPAVEDAYHTLHLLPSAPRELIDVVYETLRRRLEDARAAPEQIEELARAYATLVEAHQDGGSTDAASPRHSPWQLLHLERHAPVEVVELAYRYWQRAHEGGPPAETPASAPAPIEAPVVAPEPIEAAPPPVVASTASGAAQLVAEEGAAKPARAVIDESPLRIGTDPTCDVVVPDAGKRQGRTEARCWRREGRVLFHGVAGDVRVNGGAVGWAVLEEGDRAQVADAVFRFEQAASG